MSERHSESNNPCIDCGACCATYRVSFYWAEAEARGLHDEWVEQVNAVYGCMAGTNRPEPRCVVLQGKIGENVACGAYDRRPSTCRELQAGDDKCQKARARHALHPVFMQQPLDV